MTRHTTQHNTHAKKTDEDEGQPFDPNGLDPRSITPKKLGFFGASGATGAAASSLFGGEARAGVGGGGGVQAAALLSRERDQLASPSLATASSPGACVCFVRLWVDGGEAIRWMQTIMVHPPPYSSLDPTLCASPKNLKTLDKQATASSPAARAWT